ncbi:hypothetical protein CEXT_629271 [Caerostris extrusa]|uniref:Transmembrane protein n=1 Tax=Caerostris extrusa TaxID=172846 RepID=A0AAV4P183_CAEEX|nr:hypothetical protein CEXT_629271 [Caerostris extrusa]
MSKSVGSNNKLNDWKRAYTVIDEGVSRLQSQASRHICPRRHALLICIHFGGMASLLLFLSPLPEKEYLLQSKHR